MKFSDIKQFVTDPIEHHRAYDFAVAALPILSGQDAAQRLGATIDRHWDNETARGVVKICSSCFVLITHVQLAAIPLALDGLRNLGWISQPAAKGEN